MIEDDMSSTDRELDRDTANRIERLIIARYRRLVVGHHRHRDSDSFTIPNPPSTSSMASSTTTSPPITYNNLSHGRTSIHSTSSTIATLNMSSPSRFHNGRLRASSSLTMNTSPIISPQTLQPLFSEGEHPFTSGRSNISESPPPSPPSGGYRARHTLYRFPSTPMVPNMSATQPQNQERPFYDRNTSTSFTNRACSSREQHLHSSIEPSITPTSFYTRFHRTPSPREPEPIVSSSPIYDFTHSLRDEIRFSSATDEPVAQPFQIQRPIDTSSTSPSQSFFTNLPQPLPNGPTSAIEDLLKCFICLDDLKGAVMCPHCSKMGCKPCFERWLINERSRCPHCRHQLSLRDLVLCRFISDLQNQVKHLALTHLSQINNVEPKPASSSPITQSFEDKEHEMCLIHNANLYYFCSTCQLPMCSDCALFDAAHCGHTFQHFKQVYEDHMLLISKAVNEVEDHVHLHTTALVHLSDQVTNFQLAETKAQQEMRDILNQSVLAMHLQLADQLSVLDHEKSSLEINKKKLTDSMLEFKTLANSMPQQQLVRESGLLIDKIRMAKNEIPIPKIDTVPHWNEVHNPLMPAFVSQPLYLPNLNSKLNLTHSTRPFVIGGLSWQIYVNVQELQTGSGEPYLDLAIELVLVDGLLVNESVEYEWRIEVRSPMVIDHLLDNPATILFDCNQEDELNTHTTVTGSSTTDVPSCMLSSPAFSDTDSSFNSSFDLDETSGPCATLNITHHSYSGQFQLGKRVKDRQIYPSSLISSTKCLEIMFHVRPKKYAQRVIDLERYAAKLLYENRVLRQQCVTAHPASIKVSRIETGILSPQITHNSFGYPVFTPMDPKTADISAARGRSSRKRPGVLFDHHESESDLDSVPSDGTMALLSAMIRSDVNDQSESDGEIRQVKVISESLFL